MTWLEALVTLPHMLVARLETVRLENLLDWILSPARTTAGLSTDTGRSYTVSAGSSSTCKTELMTGEMEMVCLTWRLQWMQTVKEQI